MHLYAFMVLENFGKANETDRPQAVHRNMYSRHCPPRMLTLVHYEPQIQAGIAVPAIWAAY